ncbi:phosphoribosyl-ATP pyrophosphatase [Corynebacterium mustelae]|uniref:Phosphoribosyl-ATP pyrophosphatase n=1 Tax=Corynebacterium mustelae TaxID=571915 RepID=A0A0G3GZI4_9CORY|nr:HAD family phosphatase [Corynebacterium mustelae]AKK05940.1 phosphoribosyl-ATP pyrophosphatase [Corynebacterium mustelae]
MDAVLWDMDGTLIDSEPLWEIATYEMSESLGRRLSPKLRALTVGGTFRNTADICAEHAGVTLTEADYGRLQRTMFDRMAELLVQARVNPGIHQLLADVSEAGIPMAVVTNTPRELAEPAISAIGAGFFSAVVCGDDVSDGKPDPLIYRTAAAVLKVPTSRCLVFEDSTTGMTAAYRAGCKVVAAPGSAETRPPGTQIMTPPTFVGVTAVKLRHWFEAMEELPK